MSQFHKFTEPARRVLILAQEEAHRFSHSYIGTEHLLLGLVREGHGVAARVLSNMGVQLPKVRSAVEFIIGRGEGMMVGDIGLTERAKKVIELAVDESRRLNHEHIGTEHLLLGLVREGQGIACGVLESLGVSLKSTRRAVFELIIEPSVGLNRSQIRRVLKTKDEPCPPEFPVHGTGGPLTYRVPGGDPEDELNQDVCFATENDALLSGYVRLSKRPSDETTQ